MWLPFFPPPSHPTLAHLLPLLPPTWQGLQGLTPPHPESSQNLLRIIASFLVVLDGSEVKGPESLCDSLSPQPQKWKSLQRGNSLIRSSE